MFLLLSLFFGTFISEDATLVTAGLLVRQGRLGALESVAACAAGIFAGDLGLWVLGRLFGRGLRKQQWLTRWLASKQDSATRLGSLPDWARRHAGPALLASRFLPGTRLPLYVLAGSLGVSGRLFAAWTLLGACLWTPLIVVGTAGLALATGASASALAVTGVVVLLALRGFGAATSPPVRRRISARLARWSRWEFWPMWLFYWPVGVWVAWLAVKHRGLSTITASNPGIADGGTVGESKVEILSRLPAEWTIPFALVEAESSFMGAGARAQHAAHALIERGWRFPVVLKPDVGQRGAGVRLARSAKDVRAYLSTATGRVIVQPYHEGPFEAGVFYYRMPGSARGRILSVTDKQFPCVVGDGRSTLEDLIWSHPRYRMQAATFRRRHRALLTKVPAPGERVQLAIAGNHAQGTLFRDGRHLITPALEARIDAIAQSFDGFFVGRFDIRYRDVDAFKAGRDLAIVELNGATAESTNIYDPDGSLLEAYRQLFLQWSIVFAIGAANRARGATVTSYGRLFDLVRAYATTPGAFPVSD